MGPPFDEHEVDRLDGFRGADAKDWEIAVYEGVIAATTTPEDFYGFKVTDVECVHQRLAGVGAGVWFRLRDGRVFDMFARESTPTRELYDVTVN